jgi:Raf kinase inhibitor-like YbhB/YbcL family protein
VSRISPGEVESDQEAGLPDQVDNPAMRRVTAVVWLTASLLLLVACSASAPSATTPGATTIATAGASATPTVTASPGPSTTASPPHPSPSEVAPVAFTITSPAFSEGAAIPFRYSCNGAGVSPEIAWSGAPGGTRALALTVIDPDAGGFVHWLAYDIPGAPAGSLPENVGTGSGAPPQGRNGRGARGYTGPCPPSGTHHYVFTLYALDRPLGLTGTPTRSELEAAIKGHSLATAVLTGLFRHS